MKSLHVIPAIEQDAAPIMTNVVLDGLARSNKQAVQ